VIQVSHLVKNYGRVTALNDISFRVEKGETLGFLGPNGAGKTTTMKILTCYQPATSGTANVAGFDVHENPTEVKRLVGYLPENLPLYTEMTVSAYLRFVAEIRGVPRALKKKRMEEVMESCSLTEGNTPHKIIGTLSRGFRQRLGLAQALIHDPEVLILDEPTLGLDPKQIIEVRELIKSLTGKRTIILCSHILPEVSQTCRRIVIIHEGRIVATDTPENLTSRLKGASEILVKAEGPPEQIREALEETEGVEAVSVSLQGNAENSFRIRTRMDADLRAEISRKIVQSGWSLLELKQAAMSLEEIFLKLTTEESEVESG